MTDTALPTASEGRTSRIGSILRGTGWAIVSTYRRAGRMWLVAPAILAIAVVPEFAQHAAEVRLGMFESREAFRALANDPLRWTFAYPKVAGLILAMLATVRFLAFGSIRQALLIRPMNLLRLSLAMGLTFVAAFPFEWLREASASVFVDGVLTAISVVLQAGLLVYVIGALVDDRENSLRGAFAERWPTAVLMTLLAAGAFCPPRHCTPATTFSRWGSIRCLSGQS